MNEELKAEENAANAVTMCDKHSFEYEFYCTTCSELICKKCLSEHNNLSHKCLYVEDYGKENLKEEFTKLVQEVKKESSNETVSPSECKAIAGSLIKALKNLKGLLSKSLETLLAEIQALEKLKLTAFALPNEEELLTILDQTQKLLEAEMSGHAGYVKSLEVISSTKELLKTIAESSVALSAAKDKATKAETEFTLPIFLEELTQLRMELRKLSRAKLITATIQRSQPLSSRSIYGIKKQEDELYSYNMNTQQIAKVELPGPIPKEPTLTQLMNKLYLTGGGDYLRNTLEYNESTNQLTKKADMRIGKKWHASVVLNSKEFAVLGGYNETFKHLTKCDRYNVENDTWKKLPSMNEKKQSMAACLFQSKEIYVFGGFNGKRLNMIEKLIINPLAEKWVTIRTPDEESIIPFSCGVAGQMSSTEILILRGNKTLTTYCYEVASNTMRKGEDLKACDSFVLQTLCPTEGSLAVFGYFGSVHMFNLRARTWDESEIVYENY
jgi:hypothetical protein